MVEHVKEAPNIRQVVVENATRLKNYDTWIPKIEVKVDAIPGMLNKFYLRIMFSLGVINIGTMLIMKFIEN